MLKRGHLTIKYRSGNGNSTVITQLFNVNNINSVTKSNQLNKEKWTKKICRNFKRIMQFPSDKNMNFTNRGRKLNIFDKITKNHVPKTTLIQPFHSFQTFSQLKIIILSLEIREQLGNCRICFLSNKIRSNVNANFWIKNEGSSSKELFLWFCFLHLRFHYWEILQASLIIFKTCFPSECATWEIRHSDWTIP